MRASLFVHHNGGRASASACARGPNPSRPAGSPIRTRFVPASAMNVPSRDGSAPPAFSARSPYRRAAPPHRLPAARESRPDRASAIRTGSVPAPVPFVPNRDAPRLRPFILRQESGLDPMRALRETPIGVRARAWSIRSRSVPDRVTAVPSPSLRGAKATKQSSDGRRRASCPRPSGLLRFARNEGCRPCHPGRRSRPGIQTTVGRRAVSRSSGSRLSAALRPG